MIIRFSIENFMSFKERQTFSMIAGRGGRNKSFHVIKKKNRNDVSLLKTGIIFGANASGKSNLIKAIDFGKKIVLQGTPIDKQIQFQNFKLHKENINMPSRIEYEIKHNEISYAYGFVFTANEIKEEWLYEIDRKKENLIFERNNTDEFNLIPLLKKNKEHEQQFIDFIAKATPDNQLFLTEIRNRKVKNNVSNIDDLLNVIDWFQNVLKIIYPDSKIKHIEFELKENNELATVFEEFLKYFDTGIDGISLEEINFEKVDLPKKIKEEIKSDILKEKSRNTNILIENRFDNIVYIVSKESENKIIVRKLMTKHKVLGSTHIFFDRNEESDGTQRIMDIIPVLIFLFQGDKIFVIDEPERSLHPNLIYDLIDLFLDKSGEVKSQLILASHEFSLLTQKLLRKDEIWFTVKDKIGASSIYSLEDYDVRFDKKIKKDYLLGRYRAIPRIGNRNKLSILNK